MRRFNQLLKTAGAALMVLTGSAIPGLAQDAGAGPRRDLLRDSLTPGAWRTYNQQCVQFGPLSACQSMDGVSVGVGVAPSGAKVLNPEVLHGRSPSAKKVHW